MKWDACPRCGFGWPGFTPDESTIVICKHCAGIYEGNSDGTVSNIQPGGRINQIIQSTPAILHLYRQNVARVTELAKWN